MMVRYPFPVRMGLRRHAVDRWTEPSTSRLAGRDIFIDEGLWRRTQDRVNAAESGWRGPLDARRRMIQYYYRYSMVGCDLYVTDALVWVHQTLPQDEIAESWRRLSDALRQGRWKAHGLASEHVDGADLFTCGDLVLEVARRAHDSHDLADRRVFPTGYQVLESAFYVTGSDLPSALLERAWPVFRSGFRVKDKRGVPLTPTPAAFLDLLPAQVELGCGPSIEAGIPPLHFLHDFYRVADPASGRFIFDPCEDDLLVRIGSNPAEFFVGAAEMYIRCVEAEPTAFYKSLRELSSSDIVVGDVLTNNFDALAARIGLSERFLRRYEETHFLPEPALDPRARSLIVVGSHADRRRIQAAARASGRQILYVDPEGYDPAVGVAAYPLESPQDQDYLLRLTARQFTTFFSELCGIDGHLSRIEG